MTPPKEWTMPLATALRLLAGLRASLPTHTRIEVEIARGGIVRVTITESVTGDTQS